MPADLLALVLLLVLAYGAGTIVNRLGYPAIIGEILVGVVFGPPLLGWLQPNQTFTVLATLGTLFLMLLVGARIDARDLAKASGAGLLIAVGGFATTFAIGFLLTTTVFGRSTIEGLWVGVAISNTALATLPRILLDLDMVETRVGQFLAAVSLITVAVLLTSAAAVESLSKAGSVDLVNLGIVLAKALVFIVGAVLVGTLIFPWLRRLTGALGLSGRSNSFAIAIFIGLLFAGLAYLAGLAVILGAFMAGIFLRDDMFPRGEFPALLTSLEDMAYRFIAPVFFATAGFPFTFKVFQTSLWPLLLLLVLALFGKWLAGFLLSRFSPLSWQESAVLGFGMNAKGGVDIVVAQTGLKAESVQNGVKTPALSPEMYTIVVCLAVAGTLVTPIMLQIGRNWLKRSGRLVRVDGAAAPAPAAVPPAAAGTLPELS